jgi:hypothetical protein
MLLGSRLSLRCLALGVCCLCGLCETPVLFAQPDKHKDPLSWDRAIRGLFSQHCYSCHHTQDPSGDIDLAADTDPRLILQNREKWLEVKQVLIDGVMPPEDAESLDDQQRSSMIEFLNDLLSDLDCSQMQEIGSSPLRRLNRTEYDNAIHDLTGLDLRIAAETFPADPSSFGFENIGSSLRLTPVQVELLHSAAQHIVSELVRHKESRPRLYERFFGRHGTAEETEAEIDESTVDKIIRRTARRAFRRPVDDSTLQSLNDLYRDSRSSGLNHEQSMGQVIQSILLAPQFLFRIEKNRPEQSQPYRVDDFELASRLSFFLWSRPPDRELLQLAADDKLRETEILQQQVMRMIKDSRSVALIENFFGQWLGFSSVRDHVVDAKVFPEFSDELRQSMINEAAAFVGEVLRENRPILEMIDADYTFVDARLAEHYELEIESLETESLEIDGLEIESPGSKQKSSMTRVSLTDQRRGGLLTSAALLMVQSDPNRTNIPRRGNYIADRILGEAPPPPPPDVPELDSAESNPELTLRELFEQHRDSPACSNCHQKIDPFGFALENFDAIGRWRTEDGGFPIDASGQATDGSQFNGPVELKQYLKASSEKFLRSLSRNLLIYALGRGPEPPDDCVIQDILLLDENCNPTVADVILTIVTSRPFLYRQNPEY